jgi:hypothetical protein
MSLFMFGWWFIIVVNYCQHKGKILGQLKDLETANLVDIHNAAFYYTQLSEGRWMDYSLPDKKGDPERPIIPISIGPHIFQEAVCDFGASQHHV